MIMEKQFESLKLAMATKKMVIYPLNVEWVKYILRAHLTVNIENRWAG